MKRKEELYLVPKKGEPRDKMVKCYECSGIGSGYESVPHIDGFGGIIFMYSPVTCKHCHGWGEVPLSAKEQLSTLA